MNPDPTQTPANRPPALSLFALVLAGVAATLLFGGVLQALATSDARNLDGAAQFHLLAQAANPFVAFLALAAVAAVARGRRPNNDPQGAAGIALALAALVSAGVILLALNGILIDLTADTAGTALLRLSAVVTRLGTIALSAFALYLAATTPPNPTRTPNP